MSTRWYSYSIGELEVFQRLAIHAHYIMTVKSNWLIQISAWMYEDLHPPTASRWDSLMKLSTLRIFPMAALVHPSAAITASTSSRIGLTYSGWTAKSYNAFVSACHEEYSFKFKALFEVCFSEYLRSDLPSRWCG
jgi:hypothetical protein